MNDSMRELKETATAHLRRDLSAGRKWVCTCEACREIRALMGMDKLLGIWPLVRALEHAESQLEQTPAGQPKDDLQAHYAKLYDELAAAMAK